MITAFMGIIAYAFSQESNKQIRARHNTELALTHIPIFKMIDYFKEHYSNVSVSR